ATYRRVDNPGNREQYGPPADYADSGPGRGNSPGEFGRSSDGNEHGQCEDRDADQRRETHARLPAVRVPPLPHPHDYRRQPSTFGLNQPNGRTTQPLSTTEF